MATIKISQMPAATLPLAGTEVVPLVQSGVTKNVPVSAIGGGADNSGIINVLNTGFVIVNDGVTDCQDGFANFRFAYTDHGAGFAQSGVTISIANPAVFTLVDHGFTLNDPVSFTTIGSLPTGIVAGTTYWVISAGLTKDTFQVAPANAAGGSGEGTAIATSGSQSGVHSVYLRGHDWLNVLIPAGNYHMGGNGRIVTNGGIKKVDISAYGAVFDALHFSADNMQDINTQLGGTTITGYMQTHGIDINTKTIQLVNISDATKFKINGWVAIVALDLQGQNSFPINNHYNEFAKVADINLGTGVITLDRFLRNSYRSTFPLYYAGDATHLPTGGPAMVAAMNPSWDAEIIVRGIRNTSLGQTIASVRKISYIDCYFDGEGPVPSTCQETNYIGCTLKASSLEVDKLVDLLTITDCDLDMLIVPSTSVDRFFVSDTKFRRNLRGSARNNVYRNCQMVNLEIGPLLFGATENVIIENCIALAVSQASRLDDASAVASMNNFVPNFSFSAGTLSLPQQFSTDTRLPWAVPGQRMFVNAWGDQASDNRGSPFVVLDVRQSGDNILVDTTLTALPVGNSTNSTVTFTSGSPGTVNWPAHGLTAGTVVVFKTTGTLAAPLTPGPNYYYVVAPINAGDFKIATSPGGTAINLTDTGSGTHTGYSTPLHFQPHPCPRLTAKNCTGCAQMNDLSGAPDDAPIFSYAKRTLMGDVSDGAPGTNLAYMIVWGTIVSLKINVLRAYTGALGTLTLGITANGYDSSLIASNLTQTVNVKIAGERVITTTAATGAQAGDTIAAYAGWIATRVALQYSAGFGDTFEKTPIVEVEITTDQGITKKSALFVPDSPRPEYISDTTVMALLGQGGI